jgi:hypothetical protein
MGQSTNKLFNLISEASLKNCGGLTQMQMLNLSQQTALV